jgi:cell volume regulation protein A
VSLHELYLALLAGGLVVLVSIVATRIAERVGLPSLLLFLGVGVLLGEDVVGIRFDNAQLAQNLGTAALAVILIEGGLATTWSDIRSVVAPAGVLASLGVGVSTTVTALGAHYLLNIGWQQSLLLGARSAIAAPGRRPARGRVRLQRCAEHHPGVTAQRAPVAPARGVVHRQPCL